MITKFKAYDPVFPFSEEQKFKKGDYVVLAPVFSLAHGQIIHVQKIEKDLGTYIKYIVEALYNNNLTTFDKLRINNNDIDRLMTPEEIEEFDMKRNTIKYNL